MLALDLSEAKIKFLDEGPSGHRRPEDDATIHVRLFRDEEDIMRYMRSLKDILAVERGLQEIRVSRGLLKTWEDLDRCSRLLPVA